VAPAVIVVEINFYIVLVINCPATSPNVYFASICQNRCSNVTEREIERPRRASDAWIHSAAAAEKSAAQLKLDVLEHSVAFDIVHFHNDIFAFFVGRLLETVFKALYRCDSSSPASGIRIPIRGTRVGCCASDRDDAKRKIPIETTVHIQNYTCFYLPEPGLPADYHKHL
jgi:hypothetical protein